jgi:DNA-binding SARP family transcriptional activator
VEGAAELRLLGGFELVVGERPVALTASSQRLLALLAVAGPSLTRALAAGTLWPDRPDGRAAANLRAALWRLPDAARDVVVTRGDRLALAKGVATDVAEVEALARSLACAGDDGWPATGAAATVALLRRDLLPGWYDDWVAVERERLLLLRMQGLEALCRRLAAEGRHAEAVEAGSAAVAVEPLRESAQRALAEAYLAEGNMGAALQHYLSFEALLRDELGVGPTDDFRRLVGR